MFYSTSNDVIPMLSRFVFCFYFLLFSSTTVAQHSSLFDSIQHLSSFDRRRAVFGYSETKADILNPPGKRAIFFEQLRQFAIQQKDNQLQEQLHFMKRKELEVMEFPVVQRRKKCEECIQKYTNTTDLLFLAFCHHELGQVLFQDQLYSEAFDNDLKALELYRKMGFQNVPNIGKILHEVALHYYFFKDYHEVIRLMKIALKYPPFSDGLDIQRYNNLGMSYLKLNRLDSANHYLDQALLAAKRYNNDTWIGIISGNIGELLYSKGDYSAALAYFDENYAYNKSEKKHNTVKINSYLHLAKTYLSLDSIAKTTEFLMKAEKSLSTIEKDYSFVDAKHIGDRQQFEIAKNLYFEVKVNHLKRLGDFKTALQYQDSLMTIRKDIEEKYNYTIGKMASDRLTIQKKELMLAQKEQEKD